MGENINVRNLRILDAIPCMSTETRCLFPNNMGSEPFVGDVS